MKIISFKAEALEMKNAADNKKKNAVDYKKKKAADNKKKNAALLERKKKEAFDLRMAAQVKIEAGIAEINARTRRGHVKCVCSKVYKSVHAWTSHVKVHSNEGGNTVTLCSVRTCLEAYFEGTAHVHAIDALVSGIYEDIQDFD